MNTSWRAVISIAVGALLPLEVAPVCILFRIGPNGWIAVSIIAGIVWALTQNRIFNKVEAAWKGLESPAALARNGDGPTLLALFAMHGEPVRLFDLVIVLSPYPDPPSWLHPLRRWNVMTAWVRRNSELMAEAGRLAESGLLRLTGRPRRRERMGEYEVTGLGRDVAARNVEVLMADQLKEEA